MTSANNWTSATGKWLNWMVSAFAISLAVFHVYTAYAGPFYAISQRAIHVGLSMSLLLLLDVGGDERPAPFRLAMNLLLVALSCAVMIYVVVGRYRILRDLGYADPTTADIVLGYLMVALILEVCRRVIGWEFSLLTLVTLAYGYFGPWLPGILGHRGFSPNSLVVTSFLNPLGIYGGLTAVSATTIAPYVLFGSVLLSTGGGSAFLKIALSAAGRIRGGAAQVGVISSGLMGMINGSAVANVATVGTLTIPMMKRQGYPANFAAGVEAAASSGGQIMPPIMGAGAFVMAELLGVPYLHIATVAIIPALMYYAVMAATVYFEARKLDLKPIPASEIPPLREARRELVMLVVPVSILVYFLVFRYTPRYAAFWAIAASVAVFAVFRLGIDRDLPISGRFRDFVSHLVDSAREGAKTVALIGILVAGSQIIVAVIGLTGVGLKASEVIFTVANGNLFLGFFLAAVICLILGLGLPTVPSYIITVAVVGPALQNMGVEPIVSHFFAFFFACMSGISPPVAGVSFVAAGLAGANVWSASWQSCRLALAGFLVPFAFAFNPAMLGLGSALEISKAAGFGMIGVTAFAAAFTGHWVRPLDRWAQVALLAAGGLCLSPVFSLQIGGFALALLGLAVRPRKTAVPLLSSTAVSSEISGNKDAQA